MCPGSKLLSLKVVFFFALSSLPLLSLFSSPKVRILACFHRQTGCPILFLARTQIWATSRNLAFSHAAIDNKHDIGHFRPLFLASTCDRCRKAVSGPISSSS
ncbi:hypothetical protein METBIDRAFT_30875 [Metschnikowia bicuspidata var. bicuspidata NRRL YB-4993]|uniref:Secreted protein n=1 Tax=Metschnikowia bicuspidata var. bicuspidata NRRL YB-4993 TaxID=869754 RepID=A0A1A0HD65_9ASCO|nr:hypothetical protein METBIDRAFT_30875 [Metschnikowia bicuspidata var. bicuspidata NRRL YB-4993]OBA21873.1 hypothetical protein METBIDRAFT_30875 [Metschnikowia bicuspidata var. bicuspidata NRRL YB-4993]